MSVRAIEELLGWKPIWHDLNPRSTGWVDTAGEYRDHAEVDDLSKHVVGYFRGAVVCGAYDQVGGWCEIHLDGGRRKFETTAPTVLEAVAAGVRRLVEGPR